MPKPRRSGRPCDCHGCRITRTPTKPISTPTILRTPILSPRRSSRLNTTVAMGVIELPMPASAELTLSSPNANRLNGRLPRKKPVTIRCPHVRRSRGSRPRVAVSRSTSTEAPLRIRSPEICSGASDLRPIFISRKLDPQMKARAVNLTCQGTRVTFMEAVVPAATARVAAVMSRCPWPSWVGQLPAVSVRARAASTASR
jgi:hypothetical protein